ncbi:helix-turn-helix domain-containing protein [Pedobacter frigidisoli]|uniref:Helix-turn-helix domain-containing protein n=1 Tax=Pedobacter frigidisoli TaxID=2530455 RepID=A0A4R0NYZ7_9SPHI|nr:helix-turn-helix transcriptional regulator [Pedobacter frigidisoli]TCD07651.1 helix-turn-helix domain-containing protein [Pedobacter frigidisoli]
MEKNDISIYAKSDNYYLQLIGAYIKSVRIAQQKTQKEIAEASGINRSTLVQLEKGQPVNMLSFIQVLRSLKQLNFLQTMEITPQVSPLKLAAAEQKQIKRVRSKTKLEKVKPKSDW